MDELTAAGINEPGLRASYSECKRLNSLHGKTYFLATLLLPKAKRPHIHALYGFARFADEIVDDLNSILSPQAKAEELKVWSDQMLRDLKSGASSDKIGQAFIHTVKKFDIPHAYFVAFLHSMEMDLTVTSYATYEALLDYMYGSAAVIGLEMVPVLGYSSPEALDAAQKLGIAFQLANFIRDVGEDIDRGRIYLPLDELRSHGVDRAMLERKVLTPEILAALKEQISRVRKLQREAAPGINLLAKESRPCIEAASELYCGIVDEVEKIGFDIFNKRAKTTFLRKSKVATLAYAKARSYRFTRS